MSLKISSEALASSAFTPIKSHAHEEHEENKKITGLTMLKNIEDPFLLKAVEMACKEDPIVKYVWDNYAVYKQISPLKADDIKNFWDKVSACAALLNSKKEN